MMATLIILSIFTLTLGVHLAKNGQPRDGEYSFGWSLVSYVLFMVLFYYAGLFDNFK